jgi:hypothetical protein
VACWSHMPWLELPTLPCRCTRKGCTCTSARKEGERSLVWSRTDLSCCKFRVQLDRSSVLIFIFLLK